MTISAFALPWFRNGKRLQARRLFLSNAFSIELLSAMRTRLLVLKFAPVAQLDRAMVFGTIGWGFESLRAYLKADCGLEKSMEVSSFTICIAFIHMDRRTWNATHLQRILQRKFPEK